MSNIEQKYYTIVSNKGKQAVIKALANKELIDLTTMSVGDGESPIDTNWQTLPNEKDKFGITQIKIVDNITLEVTGILSASKGGYMITQAGLYTRDNILFAIAQLPQTAKPVLSDGASKDMTIKFVITIADTSVVNLSIDPNINIITQSHLDEVIDALKKETTTNLATKADKANTYTKTEVNNLLNAKENKNVAKGLVDALKKETTTNLATKANQSTTYTKTEVNNLVNAKANANAVVTLTGNQTVAGNKTFNGITTLNGAMVSKGANTFSGNNTFNTGQVTFNNKAPICSIAPTAANHLATKAYVDSTYIIGMMPDYNSPISITGDFTAPTEGFILGTLYVHDSSTSGRHWHINGVIFGIGSRGSRHSICIPVNKNDILSFPAVNGMTLTNLRFYPLKGAK